MDANMIGISVIIFSVLGVAVALGPDATSWWTGWVAPAILISIIATGRLPSPPGTNISEELEADAWADPLAPEPVRESA